MADVTISQLTPGTPSTSAVLPYSQSGTTNSSTVANLGLALGVGGGTGAITIPSGTTAQRPVSPVVGMLRFNTTLNTFEGWNGIAWAPFAGTFSATGGDEVFTYSSGGITYKVHKFTTATINSSLVVTGTDKAVDILIVGGGGGGGYATSSYAAAGGGAGSLLYAAGYILTAGVYNVYVGAGGTGGIASSTSSAQGNNGENSSFGSIIANGGGGGGAGAVGTVSFYKGKNGGSGGGSSANETIGIAVQSTYTGFSAFANNGGQGSSTLTGSFARTGGGGGGAGGVGITTSASSPTGNGGPGRTYDITGTSVCYAGGGGGGSYGSNIGSNPGTATCGGGAGGNKEGGAGVSATANTGGGGGGGSTTGSSTTGVGGNGASGIVVVRYTI